MSGEERMPKIDLSKLKQTDIDFIKKFEQQNADRVRRLKRIRKNNLVTAGVIGCGVLGIYFYSMLAVGQEKFLDDFAEPEKTIPLPN